MEFVDRIPTKQGRFKIIPENGSTYYAKLERADEPLAEGTPLNAANMNKLLPKPDTATVGQFFRVSEVDENGVVTAVEAVTAPDVGKGVITEGTGAAYTATVSGITALTAGVQFIMVPHTVSTSTTPTLNVNGLGAKGIRRRLSNLSTSVQAGYSASWLGSGKAYTLTYDGSYWIVEGMSKPAVADLYGTSSFAKFESGTYTGTGSTFSLTVPFQPMCFIIVPVNRGTGGDFTLGVGMGAVTNYYTASNSSIQSKTYCLTVGYTENTLTLEPIYQYGGDDIIRGYNTAGQTYNYILFGRAEA